jgi:hypothetical protein
MTTAETRNVLRRAGYATEELEKAKSTTNMPMFSKERI